MRTSALAAVAGASILALTALNGPAHAAFDKDELKCRKAMAKSFLKAITTGDKTSASCHKARNAGKIASTVDCNDLDPTEADSKGKFSKAGQKLIDAVQKKCIDAGVDGDLLGGYVSCTSGCTASLGLNDPLTTYEELGQCLPCVARELVEARSAAVLGTPDQAMMEASKESQKCAAGVAKGYGKHLATILKSRTKCQDAADKDGAMELDPTCQTSPDPDGKGKLAGALTKADEGLDKACVGADLTVVASCSTVDLPALKSCLAAENDATQMVAFPAHYELPPAICPVAVRSEIIAGAGIGPPSSTVIDVGWTGLSHRFDLPEGYSIEADITCPNSAPPCGTCTVDGLTKTGANAQNFIRCVDDFSIVCDEPFMNDADDCSGGFCTIVLGAPIPISSGGTPTCTVSALSADVTGTTDVDDGIGALDISLATRVHTGTASSLTRPCPRCVGDDVTGDGVPNGQCDAGPRTGMSCDTISHDATFAPRSALHCEGGVNAGALCVDDVDCPGSSCVPAPSLGLSLDCVPPSIENITGTGLKTSLPLSTGSHSLAAENSCDGALSALDCFCGQCTTDPTLPCVNDADCPMSGTCTVTGGGAAADRQPNQCPTAQPADCDPVGDDSGECNNLSEFYCEGLVRANGRGFLLCSNNAECVNASFAECAGNDCGPCMVEQPRPCFVDPIVVSGTADVENPVLAATFCVAPTINSGVNATAGLPGPGRVRVQQQTTLLY